MARFLIFFFLPLFSYAQEFTGVVGVNHMIIKADDIVLSDIGVDSMTFILNSVDCDSASILYIKQPDTFFNPVTKGFAIGESTRTRHITKCVDFTGVRLIEIGKGYSILIYPTKVVYTFSNEFTQLTITYFAQ